MQTLTKLYRQQTKCDIHLFQCCPTLNWKTTSELWSYMYFPKSEVVSLFKKYAWSTSPLFSHIIDIHTHTQVPFNHEMMMTTIQVLIMIHSITMLMMMVTKSSSSSSFEVILFKSDSHPIASILLYCAFNFNCLFAIILHHHHQHSFYIKVVT